MLSMREATREDVGVILQLIKDLALYEKEPEKVMCTEADLLRDGFGERPLFECILAEWAGEVIGLALYYYKWSTWTGTAALHLEDLFVKPEARGRKAGFHLLKELARIAVARHCDRFEWEVLDWNQPARDFYEALGAQYKQGWLGYRMDGEALTRFAGEE